MHNDPALEAEAADRAVLSTLVGAYPALLTEEEVQRESRHRRIDVADALARLAAAGLVHRLDGFLFASRAAVHAGRLEYT